MFQDHCQSLNKNCHNASKIQPNLAKAKIKEMSAESSTS